MNRLNTLRRKETPLILLLILSLAIYLITMELLHDKREENPIISINIPLFELIAIIIPLILMIWILFKLNFPIRIFKPISIWVIAIIIIFIATSTLTGTDYNAFEFTPSNSTITTTIPTTTFTTNATLTNISETTTSARFTREPIFSLPILNDLQNSFFILLILVSIIILLRTERRRKIKGHDQISLVREAYKVSKKIEEGPKNVIECYYQTSDYLEGRGADKSDHLTAIEFEKDVEQKELTESDDFSELTSLFSEAKFSEHTIPSRSVQQAKEVSQKIIFGSLKTKINEWEEEE